MILIAEFMDPEAVQRLEAAYPTVYEPDLADRQEEIPSRMEGVRALIVRNRTQVTAEILDAAPGIKLVGRLGVGLDNIDLDACAARSVEVAPATGANTLSVAEYVISNAMMLLRDAYHSRRRMMAGEWPRAESSGREIYGRWLGLVGLGEIARKTAKLAQALGMQVCAFDPFLAPDHPAWDHVQSMTLEELLSISDVVSLHVPLNEATHYLIDNPKLALMSKGSVLINAARGGVVDETALAEALRSGQIAGAALDVFEAEPLTAHAAEKFSGLSNIILTPHIAGVTQDSNARVSSMIADIVLDRLK